MLQMPNNIAVKKGLQDGIPIGLGYFAVAFTLGIAAKNAGFTPMQAMIVSFTNHASAGEYVGFRLIQQHANYIEFILMILVTNARYLLMSCALSQKLSPSTPLHHRLIVGYGVTDEIFGICVSRPGYLNPYYAYGAFMVAMPGWEFGTYLGTYLGNLLSDDIVSALSVGLYGMFIAIIIPPAKKNKVIAAIIVISMILSLLFRITPIFSNISSGTGVLILTVVISLAAAVLFPIKEEKEGEQKDES